MLNESLSFLQKDKEVDCKLWVASLLFSSSTLTVTFGTTLYQIKNKH